MEEAEFGKYKDNCENKDMPINMSCPSCGKTLAAPDSSAGKKAKCPSCGQIMIIPAAARQAGDFGAPPTSSEPSPQASAGGESWLDDIGGTSATPSAAVTGPGGEERKPCPECGEMIVAGAAKCRFCNAIFDPRLKAQTKKHSSTDEDLTTGDWVFCILCAGIACIFGIVYAIQGKPKGMKMVGVSIVAAVVWNILNIMLQAAINPHGFR
jgi:predicted RNA-binding Zn-ribbon protein involved in translation (DUF1610 family)